MELGGLSGSAGLQWWLLPLAIGLHNLEEIIWLPRWLAHHERVLPWRVERRQFQLAAGLLTLIAILLATWRQVGGSGSPGHYLLAGYAIGQCVNVLIPHMVASFATRSYMPGLASGLLLVIPSTAILIWSSLDSGQLATLPLLFSAVALSVVVLLSLPLLFRFADFLLSRI